MKKNYLSIPFLAMLLVYHAIGLMAQPGTLDNTFGTAGKVITSSGTNDIFGQSVLVQPDGKIVVGGYNKNAGNKDFVVVRYNSNGTIDNTFSGDGKVTTDFSGLDDYIMDAALQSNGKIVVGGYIDSAGVRQKIGMARYNADGTLDSTFSGDGKAAFSVITSYQPERIDDILIQPDGKIVAVGRAYDDMVIIRLDSNGNYDKTFNGKGWAKIPVSTNLDAGTCIALQPDGKIVAAGYVYFTAQSLTSVVRLMTDGTLDTSFSSIGITAIEVGASGVGFPSSIAIQADGKIVIVGRTVVTINVECALIRLNKNGTLDKSFNGVGTMHHGIINHSGYLNDVLIQPDGKILTIGTANEAYNSYFAVLRYNNDGSFDNTFSGDGVDTVGIGKKYSEGTCIALQPDKKIVVAGGAMNSSNTYLMCVARYFSGLELSVPQHFITDTKLYPNPANDYINLDYKLSVPDKVSIQLFDMQGRNMLSIADNEPMEAGEHTTTIAIDSLTKGIYTLIIRTRNAEQSYLMVH